MIYATSSIMAANNNAITNGSITFNNKVIAPAYTLIAATKDSIVTLPNISATKLQTNGQVSSIQINMPIKLKDCNTTITKNATFTFNGTANTTQITAFANQASSNTATNIALQIYINNGTTAITPNTKTRNILLQNKDQTLTFKVNYIATKKATSDNINAITNFHINYY